MAKLLNDIAKRKKLRYREDILDNMGSSELIAQNGGTIPEKLPTTNKSIKELSKEKNIRK